MTTLTPAAYREALRGLATWEPYLREHSNLPGPRANLALLEAVGDEAGITQLFALAAAEDAASDDPDAGWIVRENLGKARLVLLDPTWVAELRERP